MRRRPAALKFVCDQIYATPAGRRKPETASEPDRLKLLIEGLQTRAATPTTGAGGPYRTPARSESEPPRVAERELVYRVPDADALGRSFARLRVMVLGGSLAVALIFAARVPWLPPLLLALFVWRVWAMYRSRAPTELLLEVSGGRLTVRTAYGAPSLFSVPLAALRDVSLDSKMIAKVVHGQEISGLRALNTRVAPPTEVSRIVLECEDRDEPLRLTEEFYSASLNIEWFGKVRRFLRSHGWVPADEREDACE